MLPEAAGSRSSRNRSRSSRNRSRRSRKKKINKLFTGLGSVRIVKNCDLGLENAAFSRPRSQFFTIRTSQPANNIYVLQII